jgi:hypothetical protein
MTIPFFLRFRYPLYFFASVDLLVEYHETLIQIQQTNASNTALKHEIARLKRNPNP